MEDLSSCGKRLRFARKYRRMSQVDLSLATGFAQNQISTWELDKTLPGKLTCMELERALGVTWYWLRHGTETAPVVRDRHNRQYMTDGSTAKPATAADADRAASVNRKWQLR